MNILTFDIEEWITYNYFEKGGKAYFVPILDRYLGVLLDLLDAYQYKATFFCLGQLASDYPYVIKQIAGRGHEVGCHSHTHSKVCTMNPETFYSDTRQALSCLEDVCDRKITAYRAPYFSITGQTMWAFDILADLGIEIDSSLIPDSPHLKGVQSMPSQPFILNCRSKEIKEFPLNTHKALGKEIAFAGGGYFRFVPYSFIKKWTRESAYTMTFFHLRDFDREQKVVYSFRYFKSYYGIKNALPKFERYLSDFQFVSLAQANCQIDWKSNNGILPL